MSSSKRHFTVVMNSNEHGLYVSSTPSSSARKAVSKLCADNKNKKFEFSIRETTQGSNKKVYGPYLGYMEKLDKPIELKGRVIRYKPIAKLNKKTRKMKGGVIIGQGVEAIVLQPNINHTENEYTVSKLIKVTEVDIEKVVAFETKLNEIDPTGRYHINMLEVRRINDGNINKIENISQKNKNNIKRKEFNFKITYEFGGISIDNFTKNFTKYEDRVDKNFCKNILFGIANIFEGLYVFNKNGLNHLDFHKGNIVFFIDDPARMRIIDWGYLLEPINDTHPYVDSLFTFYNDTLSELIGVLKSVFKKESNKIIKKLDDFLKIPELFIFKKRSNTTAAFNSNNDKFQNIPGKIFEFVAHFDD
jgi:hypothetical protein